MGLYKNKFNPVSGSFNLVPTGTIITFKDGVANATALPLIGNTLNDARITADVGHLYVWDGTTWVDSGDIIDLKWSAIDGKPTSLVSDIDNAVSLRHAAHSDDQDLSGKVDKVSGKSLVFDTEIAKIHALHADDQDLSGKVDKITGSSLVADTEIAKIHAPHSDDQVIPDQLSDLSDDATHRLVTDTEKSTWNGKQNALGFTPEDVSNKRSTFQVTPDDSHYPSEKLTKDSLDGKAPISHTHAQSNVIDLVDDLKTITLNIMLNAFRIAQIGSLTIFNMVKGFMDEYEDTTGIDGGSSINAAYNSTDDYYYPSSESYTKLLLHLNNNVTDESPNAITVTNNNVTFSDSIYKFSTHSAYFNGSNAQLSLPAGSDYTMGTDDFTIDFWIKTNVPQANNSHYVLFGNQSSTFLISLYGVIGQGEALSCYFNGIQIYGTHFDVVNNNSWHHIAIVRASGTITMYLDGVVDNSVSNPGSIGASTTMYLGYDNLNARYAGYMDEVRVSKGIARWTAPFTPPTNPYSLLMNNMTLLSNAKVANIVPTTAQVIIFEEDVDSITLNTDLKVYISRDNGIIFSQVTLSDEGNYITGARILSGIVDISSQPSGTNMKYKIETLNNKNLKIHGTSVNWR